MKIVTSIRDLPDESIAITIGNFDGVHRGHQAMLSSIIDQCRQNQYKLVVITFRPHPVQILRPRENFLINSYKERSELLSQMGVDYLIEIPFTRDLSTLLPEDFLDKFVMTPSLQKIFIGHDFAFGAQKKGDADFIASYSKSKQIDYQLMNEYSSESLKYSSTSVRNFLNDGDVVRASEILGRNFYVSGRIVKGAGRGKTIGFPTANISYDEARIIPQRGVYVTKTHYRDQLYYSVSNIGHNPTFSQRDELSVETYILDFDQDIYGEEIKVEFIKRLRDERKFSSVNDLIVQIRKDVEQAREIFSHD